jgi:hypothetical protein
MKRKIIFLINGLALTFGLQIERPHGNRNRFAREIIPSKEYSQVMTPMQPV